MQQYNCIIIEDEPLATEVLQDYIADVPFLKLINHYSNAMSALSDLNKQQIDLIFLDINLPKLKGIDFIKTLKNPPHIIITTAYHEYALQGYDLNIVDYLLKPIPYERFLKAAWKARDYFALHQQKDDKITNPYIFAKANGRLEKINFDEILFIEGMENYAAIYLQNKKLIIHTTIKALLEKLPAGKFLQTHKSYIVAISKIESIDGNMLNIQKHQVPISKYLREAVLGQIIK